MQPCYCSVSTRSSVSQIAYKYLHPDRLDVLKNGLIRFTQAAALNDPFESTPCLIELERYLRNQGRERIAKEQRADELRIELSRLFPDHAVLRNARPRDLTEYEAARLAIN